MGRKKYNKELKARIAFEAIKGQKTIAELASEYGIHANQISIWKKQLLDLIVINLTLTVFYMEFSGHEKHDRTLNYLLILGKVYSIISDQ